MIAGRRARPLLLWGLTLAVLVAAAILFGQLPRRVIDLKVYLLAAERFLEGSDLYRTSDGGMPFKYPAPAAWFFVPWAVLPTRLAGVLWNLGSVLALGASASLLLRRNSTRAASLLPALIVIAHPLLLELHYGQVDLWMLLLLLLAMDGAAQGASGRAGACLAVAVLLKPPALIVVLLFLFEKRFRALGAALVVSVLLWAPVLLRYGVHGTWNLIAAWRSLVAETTAPWALGHNPQGLPTLLLQLTHSAEGVPTETAMTVAQLAAVLLAFALLWAFKPDRDTRFDLACAGVALLSPLAWRANLILAFPLVVRTLSSSSRTGHVLSVIAGLVGIAVTEWLLEPETFRTVMLWRPFALAYLALALWALIPEPASPAPHTK